MKSRLASALGAMALGWSLMPARAAEPAQGSAEAVLGQEPIGGQDAPPDSFLQPADPSRWSGGVGLWLAKPYFENNPAYWLGRYDLHQRVGVAPPPPPPPPPPPLPLPVPPPEPIPPVLSPPVTKGQFLASEFVLSTDAQGKQSLQPKHGHKGHKQGHESGNGPPCGLPPGPPPGGPPHGGPPWDLPKGPPPKNCGPGTGGGGTSPPSTQPPQQPPAQPPQPPTQPPQQPPAQPPPQQPPTQPPTQPPQQPPQVVRWRSVHSIRRKDFDPEWELAPHVWLGWQSADGVGVRGRFWRFHQQLDEFVFNPAAGANGEAGAVEVFSAEPLGLSINSPGPLLAGQVNVGGNTANFNGAGADFLMIQSSLELWTIDLEATEEGRLGRWRFLAGAGLRYAHLAQSYNAYRFNRDNVAGVANVEADAAVLLSGHQFKGLGPTVTLEAKRPIADSAFALYGQARGSMLFGKSKQRAHLAAVVSGTATGGGLPAGPFRETAFIDAAAGHDDVLPVVELEAGVEWIRDLRQSQLFIQTGVVAQNWFGAGGASSEEGNLGFLGLSLSFGLRF